MAELLTAAQMRALERAAIDSGAVTGLELMERAGQGVVAAVLEEWPELAGSPHRAVILCGPGNNGGDGFVVARLLKERGWEVDVFLYGEAEKLPPDARANCERWLALGSFLRLPADRSGHDPWNADLIVDAIFGTGLARPISFDWMAGTMLPEWDLRDSPGRPRIVAVDVPSGLCSDSGRTLDGDALWADLTVTFHRPKLGHYLADGPSACGTLALVDIGIPGAAPTGPADTGGFVSLPSTDQGAAVARLAETPRDPASKRDPFGRATHKYAHGHALILSGPPGRTGAARLAARGALRIGAGLVTLAVPPAAQMEVASQITAIMLRRIQDAPALTALLEDTRLNALCLGPGLGTDDRAAGLVAAALEAGRPTVLDADALTLLSRDDSLVTRLHDNCVLTPHGGEFKRLFPDIADRLAEPATKGPAYSKVDATRDAAARAGCTILYKGPDTVIANARGEAAINASVYDRAAPWLATAGSGDVLAGFIAGLLARGFAPMAAAETAAWLHTEAALSFGPGLIAEDLPEELPKVFRRLGL